MKEAAFYCFHDLTLEVGSKPVEVKDHLVGFLEGLSWVKISRFKGRPTLRFFICPSNNGFKLPSTGHECLRADEFSGLEAGDDFYLTDGSSHFHLKPALGKGYARLAPSFFDKPALVQGNFWSFGLLKLLRPLGIYSLHAAGMANGDGLGLLIVGASGSGKSTLAIGLIRDGWRYLSDDALLLRLKPHGVEAVALRKSFYIDAVQSPDYSDLPLGEEVPVTRGRQKRRVCIEQIYPEQYLSRCIPRLLVFPRIIAHDQSRLVPMDRVRALKILLEQSGPQLFDTNTMDRHLDLLKKLLQQAVVYELKAGTDLYRNPAKLIGLLQKAQGQRSWHGSLSS